MEQANIDGISLEYEVRGSGEPVVFIHGAHMGDTYTPLMAEPALKDYRFIGYHRRGYAGSGRPEGALSISEHAADCLGLLRKLSAVPAQVVGQSSGAIIGILLALVAPEGLLLLAAVVTKWVVLGRIRPGRHPLWEMVTAAMPPTAADSQKEDRTG